VLYIEGHVQGLVSNRLQDFECNKSTISSLLAQGGIRDAFWIRGVVIVDLLSSRQKVV
jgi:hypothetical protein